MLLYFRYKEIEDYNVSSENLSSKRKIKPPFSHIRSSSTPTFYITTCISTLHLLHYMKNNITCHKPLTCYCNIMRLYHPIMSSKHVDKFVDANFTTHQFWTSRIRDEICCKYAKQMQLNLK